MYTKYKKLESYKYYRGSHTTEVHHIFYRLSAGDNLNDIFNVLYLHCWKKLFSTTSENKVVRNIHIMMTVIRKELRVYILRKCFKTIASKTNLMGVKLSVGINQTP